MSNNFPDIVPEGIYPDYIRHAFIMCRPFYNCVLTNAKIDEQAFAWEWMEWICEYESLERLPDAIEVTHPHSEAREWILNWNSYGEKKEIRVFIRPDGYYRTEHTEWSK